MAIKKYKARMQECEVKGKLRAFIVPVEVAMTQVKPALVALQFQPEGSEFTRTMFSWEFDSDPPAVLKYKQIQTAIGG